MKIEVDVKTSCRVALVEKITDDYFKIKTREPAKENRANKMILKMLADYLNISSSRLRIISGHKNKKKIIKIDDLC